MSLPLSVFSQSGPPKSVGGVRGVGGVGGRIPHFNWSIYRGGPPKSVGGVGGGGVGGGGGRGSYTTLQLVNI